MSTLPQKIVKAISNPDLAIKYVATHTAARIFYNKSVDGQTTRDGDFYHTPRIMHPVDRMHLHWGSYEADERELLPEMASVDVIIEIGANIGYMARHAFHKLNAGGRYIAVEPNPEPQNALKMNMLETRRQHPECDYSIVQAAICGRDGGTVDFVAKSTLGSGLAGYVEQGRKEAVTKVPARSLSSIVREHVGLDKTVSLICDAEGAEIVMLREDRGAFAAFSDIAIELHPRRMPFGTVGVADMVQAFAGMGFDLVRQERDGTCCLFKRSAPQVG